MKIVERLLAPRYEAHAHCDLFCGTYDPAQAMIEAKSVLNCCTKYHASDDDVFRARCISIKEERAELVKHHLTVLWADFFKPPHLEQFPVEQFARLAWIATQASRMADSGSRARGARLSR